MTDLVIVGCGGFGREVRDLVDDLIADGADLRFLGYVDDNPGPMNRRLAERRGGELLGTREWFASADRNVHYVIGVGNGAACRSIDRQLTELGFPPATLVHPAATVGSDVRLGPGTIVCAGARCTTNITIGRHVHIDRNCVVGHDAVLEDYAILYPLAAVSGGATVGSGALLGTQSAVLQQVRVGADATVGAGAVVTRDVPPGVVAKGVPARYAPTDRSGADGGPP